MNIDNVASNTQSAATADTTTVEQPRQTEAAPSEQFRVDSATGRQQSVLRDPGERMLASDAWHGTPASERSLSNGPLVPTLANPDLLQAVDHAVKFVMSELS